LARRTLAPAVFVDRDGVINDLVFNKIEETVSSPLSSSQIRVFPYIGKTVTELQKIGFKVVVISNQPGVAKRQFSFSEFLRMRKKVNREILRQGAKFDGEYYCLHHPYASITKYRKSCDCRKPKPGLFFMAAREKNIDLGRSFFIGDSLEDVKAGKAAGVKTVLVGHVTNFLNRMLEVQKIEPDFMISSLQEAPALVSELIAKEKLKPKATTD
jgi:D-glycero-D-manno-heptose 1,7-bisphosphate phosphatase